MVIKLNVGASIYDPVWSPSAETSKRDPATGDIWEVTPTSALKENDPLLPHEAYQSAPGLSALTCKNGAGGCAK